VLPYGWAVGPDKYVFIEQFNSVHGELIEGEYPTKYIDYPTYSFDDRTGTLNSMVSLNFVNQKLKVVLGTTNSLSGAAGSGRASFLHGAFELPYAYEIQSLKIVGVEADGMAYVEFEKRQITLKAGQEWGRISSTVETPVGTAKVKMTTTDTIVNHGIVEKSKIVAPKR